MHLLPAHSGLISLMLLLLSFFATASPLSKHDNRIGPFSTTTTTYHTTLTYNLTSYIVATTTTRTPKPVSFPLPSNVTQETVYVTDKDITTTTYYLSTDMIYPSPVNTYTTTATAKTTITEDVAATTETVVAVPSTISEPWFTTATIQHNRTVTKYSDVTIETNTDVFTPETFICLPEPWPAHTGGTPCTTATTSRTLA